MSAKTARPARRSTRRPAAKRAAAKRTVPNPKGISGPTYTKAQIRKGLAARAKGKTNAEVARAAGVKSPQYFSKTLKAVAA